MTGNVTAPLAPPPTWQPLGKENAKATQQHLIHLLGMSREVFRATCYAGQDDAPAWLRAKPAQRKAMLGEILDPAGAWAADAEYVRREAKAVTDALAQAQAKIAAREEIAAQVPSLDDALEDAHLERAKVQRTLADAEETLVSAQAAVAANAAAAERHRAAQQALAAATQERARAAQALAEAEGLAEKLPGLRARIAEAEGWAVQVADLEQRVEEQRQAAVDIEKAQVARQAALLAEQAAGRELARIVEEHAALADKQAEVASRYEDLQQAEPGSERCALCEQILGVEAREATLAALSADLVGFTPALIQLAIRRDEATAALQAAAEATQAIEIPEVKVEDWETPLRAARQAAESLSGLRVLLQATEDHAGRVPAFEEALGRAEAALQVQELESARTAEAVQDKRELGRAAESAGARQQGARAALDGAAAQVVRLEEQLRQARAAEAELAGLRKEAAEGQARLDLLALATRAFGRDGIPVLLVETVLAQLDADANAILRRFPLASGWTFSLRFETQREQVTTEALKEELYVVVQAPDYEQDFASLSGGETSRVSFAVRVALGMLLGRLRGAESRLLILDELPFLDESGEDRLVALIHDLVGDGVFSKVLAVSHSPLVKDSFDACVEVENVDGRSRVVELAP